MPRLSKQDLQGAGHNISAATVIQLRVSKMPLRPNGLAHECLASTVQCTANHPSPQAHTHTHKYHQNASLLHRLAGKLNELNMHLVVYVIQHIQ